MSSVSWDVPPGNEVTAIPTHNVAVSSVASLNVMLALSCPPCCRPVITRISSEYAGAENGHASSSSAPKPKTEHHVHAPDRQSLAASIATLLLTLPALVGS